MLRLENAEENILNDTKEIEEHQKVVAMVKSEFSCLSDNVWVERESLYQQN
jgi:isochorismate synthase EntC